MWLISKHKYIFCFFILIIALSACMNINDFSSDTSIYGVDVVEIYTPNVILDTTIVDSENGVLLTELSYGVHNFPISFRANIALSSEAKLFNINKDSIVFTSRDEELTFFVNSLDGTTRQWIWVLNVVDRNSDANLIRVDVANYDEGSFVANKTAIIPNEKTVQIFALQVNFPLSMNIFCSISDSATFDDFDNGARFTFNSYDDVVPCRVLAADGLLNEWNIQLVKGEAIVDNNQVPWSQWRDISLFKSLDEFELVDYSDYYSRVDWINNVWRVILPTPLQPQLPINLRLNTTLPEYVELIGMVDNRDTTLNKLDNWFFLYDTQRLQFKKWRLLISQYLDSTLAVNGVSILQSSGSNAIVDVNNVSYSNDSRSLYIPISTGEAGVPISINSLVKYSSGSTQFNYVTGSLICREFSQYQSFVLTAEDGTSIPYYWTLNEMPNPEIAVAITSWYSSREDRVILDDNIIVNNKTKTIALNILEWSDYLPLTVQLQFAITSSLSLDGGLCQSFYFANKSDQHLLSYTASDGTTGVYTLKLNVNESEKSSEADLITFEIKNISDGFDVDNINIDNSAKVVNVVLSKVSDSKLLNFTPQITVSDGASVTELNSGISYSVDDYDKPISFTITSEDESNKSVWKLCFVPQPQIDNYMLDVWNNSTTPYFWSSANNAFGKNTMRADRDGGYCAKLETIKMVGNVAAASLFLGKFKMDLSHISNPRLMTYFGVPFFSRPVAIEFDYKYFSVDDDKGSLIAELLNFDNSSVEYHGIGDEQGVSVVARASTLINAKSQWSTLRVDFDYISPSIEVNNIHIVFSSSYLGDQLVGGQGATLFVDNVRLIY